MSDPRTLLSVPPAVTGVYHRATGADPDTVHVTHDPPGAKLGSGGGTAHLLADAWRAHGGDASFSDWLAGQSRVLLHAGGQSRRLPAYAAIGKALVPVPVFRWSTGQRLDQTLMDVQRPLLRDLLDKAPDALHTVVASGDVLVWHEERLPPLPDVDVLCVGLWSSPEVATRHGVFFTPRARPGQFEFMLQKPSPETIQEHASDHLFLLDVGIWLFSDRAIDVLMRKCGWNGRDAFRKGVPDAFDLYSAFGLALGRAPTRPDPEISSLDCAVLPLGDGEFYHFGTSGDLVHSALALQNRVYDQRKIHTTLVKPHPAIFVQNAYTPCPMDHANRNVWIENACLGPRWQLHENHVITGIPDNDWAVDLPPGVCLDVVPLPDDTYAARPYGFHDPFRGRLHDPETLWMGRPALEWFRDRDLPPPADADLQQAPLFAVCTRGELTGEWIQWLIHGRGDFRDRYARAEKLSAEDLASRADVTKLLADRRRRLAVDSLPALARHAHRSVFYQVDLEHVAELYRQHPEVELPDPPDPGRDLNAHIHDRMFRSRLKPSGDPQGAAESAKAFAALREAIIDPYLGATGHPRNTLLSDQVIWARSPVRLDLAGGWTDTPPYCFLHGGDVVNLAVELNGQPPIQVFARVGDHPHITLRSIDLGITQRVDTYARIGDYAEIGSGFSIPKAALALAGFHPDFQAAPFTSLEEQLRAFGGGIELSLLCAVPKGSGLGTSSILAATTLAALSELCGHGWDRLDLGNRTLALEQMLTSGGGWQDQFGGITRGLKLLRTSPGLDQTPEIRWLPDHLFTDPAFKENVLLYYTGITRVAKDILAEIVQSMFLNRRDTLATLTTLKSHAGELYETIQKGDFVRIGEQIGRTWRLNQDLDPGTNPPEVAALVEQVAEHLHGCKLLGAGGGGYLLMIARDGASAARVREHLAAHPPNPRARFVDIDLSRHGLQVTRS